MQYPSVKFFQYQSLWISHSLLLLLSITLFSTSISWIFQQLLSAEHRFSQLSLTFLMAVLVYQLIVSDSRPKIQVSINPWAAMGLIFAGILFLLNEFYIAINIFSAICTILALYALLGLFIDQHTWQKGILYAFIFVLLLPFGDYFDVFFGFPLRLASAQAASDLLMAFGYAPQNIQTLIELDNQLTHVDLSCSGIHGLWSGIVFFVLLSWIEHKTINGYWLLLLMVFLALIVAINVLRISLMVILEVILQQSQFAELIHNSIGIIGFAMACILGWIMLIWLKPQSPPEIIAVNHTGLATACNQKNKKISWLLVLVLLLLNFLYTPMVKEVVTISHSSPAFAEVWHEKRIPLNLQEQDFFPRQGAYAQKYQFNRQGLIPGSVIFVNTHYWKAHHDPKNCFQAQGYVLINEQSIQFADKMMIRKLLLRKDEQDFTAYYWFQSRNQQTADFSQRLFSGLVDTQSWTMVSMLVERTSVSSRDREKKLLNDLSRLVTSWIETNKRLNTNEKNGKNK